MVRNHTYITCIFTMCISKKVHNLYQGRVSNIHMPYTNTLYKVIVQLPLTVKGVNNIETIKGT